MDGGARSRLERLLCGARRLADPADSLGRTARARLSRSSGLSPENVEWGLRHALEAAPSEAELDELGASVEPRARSHVLLSANVFVAAHRAIALALAASPQVYVRPSRREPEMTELLAEAAPGVFERVSELAPRPGDQVFAYGRAETLQRVADSLPVGVTLWRHGPGFGVVVASSPGPDSTDLARALSVDIAAFEQRGCLSPRVLLYEGGRDGASELARSVASALAERQREVPLGQLSEDERADIARYRDTLLYTGELYPAGDGFVGVAAAGSPLTLAPVGRNLHIIPVRDAATQLASVATAVTTFAYVGPEAQRVRLAATLPNARVAEPGRMQTPRFDGPVDRRLGASRITAARRNR